MAHQVKMGLSIPRKYDEQVDKWAKGAPVVKRAKPLSPEEIQKRFGERIREVRQQKGISQEALALSSDVDRAYLGGVERGERNISLINFYKIARGLGVPASELMPGEGRAARPPAQDVSRPDSLLQKRSNPVSQTGIET